MGAVWVLARVQKRGRAEVCWVTRGGGTRTGGPGHDVKVMAGAGEDSRPKASAAWACRRGRAVEHPSAREPVQNCFDERARISNFFELYSEMFEYESWVEFVGTHSGARYVLKKKWNLREIWLGD